MAGGHPSTENSLSSSGRARTAPDDRSERTAQVVYDLSSDRSDWSDGVRRIAGLPTGRLPRTWDEVLALVHPDDRSRVVAQVKADLAARRPCELECRIVRGDGEVGTIRCRADVRRDRKTGRVRRVFGSARDVTGQRPEPMRRHADALLALVVERCREIIFIRDAATGRLIYCSPSFAPVAGIPVERMPEDREAFLAFVHPDDRECVRTKYREVLTGPVTLEWRLVRPDGGLRWMVSRLVPLREGEDVTRVAGISEDVTDRHASEEAERRRFGELARAAGRSAVWETATALAHEIHQPLFTILNYARGCVRRLKTGRATENEVTQVCDRIAAEAERSSQVVRRLQDLARGRPPATRPDDLNAVVTEALRLAGPETVPFDVVMQLDLDPAAPQVLVDRVEIQQTILNLVRNAAESMAHATGARRLQVRTRGGATEATVSVSDTGCGIDPATAERLFDPFLTTKAEGSGMGLAICRTLVEAHGGRIWAEPREGGGTVFTFAVPIARTDVAAHA